MSTLGTIRWFAEWIRSTTKSFRQLGLLAFSLSSTPPELERALPFVSVAFELVEPVSAQIGKICCELVRRHKASHSSSHNAGEAKDSHETLLLLLKSIDPGSQPRIYLGPQCGCYPVTSVGWDSDKPKSV